jgi:hypothetical protein
MSWYDGKEGQCRLVRVRLVKLLIFKGKFPQIFRGRNLRAAAALLEAHFIVKVKYSHK